MAILSDTATEPKSSPAAHPSRNARTPVSSARPASVTRTAAPTTRTPIRPKVPAPVVTSLSCGAVARRKATRPAKVSSTARTSCRGSHRRDIAARMGGAKTMPMIAIGWTRAIGPKPRAIAWKSSATKPSSWPSHQIGRCARWAIRPAPPVTLSGASPAARCWTEVENPTVNALASASTTASQITLPA